MVIKFRWLAASTSTPLSSQFNLTLVKETVSYAYEEADLQGTGMKAPS